MQELRRPWDALAFYARLACTPTRLGSSRTRPGGGALPGYLVDVDAVERDGEARARELLVGRLHQRVQVLQ